MEWSETQGCISHNTAWLGQSALQSSDQPRNSPVSIQRRSAITGDQQLDTARQTLERTRVGTFHTRAIPVQLGYTGDGGHRQESELWLQMIIEGRWLKFCGPQKNLSWLLYSTVQYSTASQAAFAASSFSSWLYSLLAQWALEQLVKWMGKTKCETPK